MLTKLSIKIILISLIVLSFSIDAFAWTKVGKKSSNIKETSFVNDTGEQVRSSGWTRIGRERPVKIDVTKESEKPWMKQKRLIEAFEVRNIKNSEESSDWKRVGKEKLDPEIKEEEEIVTQKPEDDINVHRKLSEWTRVGPEKKELPQRPERPKIRAKKRNGLTIDERLENLDLDESMLEIFDDERFSDIAQRINKHNKWKRLKNIGRVKNEKH